MAMSVMLEPVVPEFVVLVPLLWLLRWLLLLPRAEPIGYSRLAAALMGWVSLLMLLRLLRVEACFEASPSVRVRLGEMFEE
jgi:hypothetical protein